MSNENFAYGLPYSSLRPHRQAPQVAQPGNIQAENASSSAPYYGAQTTAAATATHGTHEYQSQRYTQQWPSNSGPNFNWYSNAMSNTDASQSADPTGNDDMGGNQSEGSGRPNSQTLYGGSSLGSYAYNSTLNYASNRGSVQERKVGTYSQSVPDGRASNEDFNVRIPYQPYMRNFEQSEVGSAGSNSSQEGIERRAPVEQASGMQSYKPLSQAPMKSAAAANSYPIYPSNTVMPRSNVASFGNRSAIVESTVRCNAQNTFSSKYGFKRNQVPGLQTFQDPRTESTPTPPPVVQVRKLQAATRITQRQKTTTPPSHIEQSANSLPHPNEPQYMDSPRADPSSTANNLATTAHSTSQLKPGHRYNIAQSSQSYNTHPLASEYQSISSGYNAQIQEESTPEISRDPLVNLRPPSSPVPTTVDPSHVYNRYHEYQKQIEAADAEHARLAALREEREAAEAAAAAALASAKSIFHTKSAAQSQLENERTREVRGQIEIQSNPAQNSNKSPHLSSTDQAANQNVSDAQSAALDPQVEPKAADPQKVAAMEDEMRLMVEKMREYQTQDPQLFAHVWESVKKTQAPRPTEAQMRTGEDLISTSIESQNRQLPSPVSISAHQTRPLAPRSEPTEVPSTSAKPPRKRKSRSKAALAEQSAQKSVSLSVQERERIVPDVAPTTASHIYSGINPQNQAQNGPSHINRKVQNHTGIPVQNSSLPPVQHAEIPNLAQRQPAMNGMSSQDFLKKSAQPNQTKENTTNRIPIEPTLPRQSSQTVQLPTTAVVTSNPRNTTPATPGANHCSATQSKNKTGVLWPVEHRNAIANTAAKVLNAIPENAGKKIAAFQILDMLGYDPSYIELCEFIEGIGFKLDRGRFAVTLLAAIPTVSTTPAQPAESMLPQISNKPVTSKEYQPKNSGFSKVAEEFSSIWPNVFAPDQVPSLPIDVPSPVAAPQWHSEIAQNNTTPSSGEPESRGPGSRGPYRKTRECMSEAQNSPSILEKRRGPGRPRKHELLPTKGSSNSALQENYSVDPALVNAPNPKSQTTMQSASPAALKTSLISQSDDIEDRLVFALTGRVIPKKDLITTTSSVNITNPAGVSVESSSELQPHNNGPAGQSINGWGSRAINRAVNGEAVVANPPTLPSTLLTKEMAARKRTFADIIDLTSEDIPASMEGHPLVASKVRRVGDTNFQGADRYDGAQEPKTPNASFEHQSPLAISTTRVPKPSQSHHPTSSTVAAASQVSNPYKDFKDIVKPIDRSVALRKSRYDPRTVACDILIATSRHPFQRGLNAHLEPLKARFTKVDDSSDLFTFRWDIVDPGGPPVGPANMSVSLEELQNESSMSAGYSSSSRLVLDGVKLPVGQGPLRPTRGGGSIRGRGRTSLLQSQTVTPAQPSGLRFTSTAESNFAVVIDSTPTGTSDPGHSRNPRLDGIESASPARRQGRPPKNLSATSQHMISLPKRIGRPPKSLSKGIGIRGNPAGHKVGRSRIYPLSESKPKGRPRKSDPKPATPKFIPFLCEWKDCKAELHNLETLRRHVYSVHPKSHESEAIPCRWSRCGLTRQVHDESTPCSTPTSTPEPKFVHKPHEFTGMQEFKDHMEKAHLIPFAWHMGDGPRGSTLDGNETDASTYLSDAAGNQVTPSIASQAIERGNAKINNARRVAQQKRPYDPALESPVELATPGMRAKFFMGTEWKRIKAPSRAWRGLD